MMEDEGIDHKQAEAIARSIELSRLDQDNRLATKGDLITLEARIDSKLDVKIGLLRKDLEGLENMVRTEITLVRKDMEHMGDKIVIRGCSIIIAAMFLFFKLGDVIEWFSK
jgi:hypothetical protein